MTTGPNSERIKVNFCVFSFSLCSFSKREYYDLLLLTQTRGQYESDRDGEGADSYFFFFLKETALFMFFFSNLITFLNTV